MSSWDQANRGGKLGLVWRNKKKISQIINIPLLTVLPLNYFMSGKLSYFATSGGFLVQ
jgi:hypothetical protein